jgi:hypothetical protein
MKVLAYCGRPGTLTKRTVVKAVPTTALKSLRMPAVMR